jgi:hypothetical protein
MSVIMSTAVPVSDSIQRDPVEGTPLTYGLLRHVLLDSGSIDLREALKMDRAFHRLLDT